MAKIPALDAVRIIPRDTDFLDRRSGNRGEIFYDRTANTLRLYDGATASGVNLAKSDLTNIDNIQFRAKSVESRISAVVYTVTITGPQGGDTGNKYNLNGVYRPEPNFVVGYTYVFVQDDQTNVYFPNANGTTPNPHPLNFSADNLSGLLGGGTSYLSNVRYFLDGVSVTQAVYRSAAFNTATSRQVWITVTNSTPSTLYYWCYNHQAMGNEITVADPGSGTGGNAFQSIKVTGQDDVVAEAVDDFVNFTEGAGISISTTAATDTITFTNTGVLSISAGAGISVADNAGVEIITNTGVLSIVAGTGITISVDQGEVTINSVANTGNVTFTGRTVDSDDSTAITFTPSVVFDSDVTVYEIVFPDGSRQVSAAGPTPGPQGEQGPPGAAGPVGAGAGDVISLAAPTTDNAIVRYHEATGTIIQNSLAVIDDSGVITASGFSGIGSSLTALNASELTSGTIPDARFPATLPAASGVNLTALNATNLGSGTVPVARLGTAGTRDATTFLRGDNTWAVVAGGGGSSDSFATISVAGQSDVVADSATDTLTLVAGTGITITTNAGADSITIANSAAAANAFETIAVAGQSSVVADSATDTLTLVAGTGITITTDAGTDTITVTSTVSAGATTFAALTDNASATIDQIYLPAITALTVTNNGASAYRFDQYGTADNPTVYAINGTTIAFKLNVSGHPFLIQNGAGVNYDTGLIHVSTTGAVATGASAQGQTSGTLYWKIPTDISGGYRYQCSAHAPMVGSISIKTFATI
jgi:plastocyanin